MDTTPEEAAQVVALLQQGLSQRAVAAQLHLSQSAVSRVYRRFQETGAFNRRPRTGRHRCTSERDDRFIVSTSLRNRHLTGVDVQQELRRVRQVAVSEWTVRRRLKEANLTPKRPASGPKLTAGHRQARLQFAREHLDWSIAQWRSVLFTDECRVCLHGSDRRGRVYRRPGERFAQCCFAETVAYGGGSCMMWAGISLEGKTALVFVPGGGRGGGLTADRYITDILLGHVVPYAEFVGEDFVLMHDNARCHTARVSRQFLREKELRTMDWPALSPDLNPIEHLWDELKRRVRARNPVPASVDELKTALLEEWDGIPQETVKKLIRYLVPVLNPDGYVHTHVNDRMWRKNRARHDNKIVGVDLNRNFGPSLNSRGEGASVDPNHLNYRGPAPFSEPETAALRDTILNSVVPFKLFLTFHAFSEAIAFPWGATHEPCPDYVPLLEGATVMAKAIEQTSGRLYKVGAFKDIMYRAEGTSIDWSYGTAFIPFSYLIELRSKQHKFLLPNDEIEDTCKEILSGVLALAEHVDKQTCVNLK
ncbi:unnamed protein product [Plutella xylostella]|uniref:(diamondback moth) hypothetical protein n=1 Tax=Plutella xylostella TaxID=51655 RepID=A0A8S4E8J4_PLUXY|nr:unnamed protein product [Plutella xylostella]